VNQYGRYTPFINMAHGAMDGNGARIDHDGVDSGGSYMSCPNVEWMEMQYPLLYLFRRHALDSAGPGKFRGGVGVESAHMLHDAPEGKIRGVAYGVAGAENSGHGMFDGHPGALSVMQKIADSKVHRLLADNQPPTKLKEIGGRKEDLPYCNFELCDGDVLYMRVASGGGYGDPLERDPELVRSDVANGIVSCEVARDVYGVVLGPDLVVDGPATQKLRADLRRRQPARTKTKVAEVKNDG
jgi:N-methylhydantoinase B